MVGLAPHGCKDLLGRSMWEARPDHRKLVKVQAHERPITTSNADEIRVPIHVIEICCKFRDKIETYYLYISHRCIVEIYFKFKKFLFDIQLRYIKCKNNMVLYAKSNIYIYMGGRNEPLNLKLITLLCLYIRISLRISRYEMRI